MTTMHRDDLVMRYRSARMAYEKATDEFFRRWADLNVAKARLDRWREVGFVNTDADLPPKGNEVIDARAWPDASELARLIGAIRDAESEYRSAWDALPDELRSREPLALL